MILRLLGMMVSLLAWSLAGGVILVLLTGVMSMVLTPLVGVPMPIVALFAMLILARLVRRARQRRALTVVGYLEQAARLNLPLPQMLVAAQRSERGSTSRRLGDIRRAVESGMPVGEALENYAPEVPWHDQQEIAVGERLGRLSSALTRVHRRTLHRLRGEACEQDMAMGWSYGLVIGAFLLFILGGVTVLILPKYLEIFDDFDATLPWATEITFAVGSRLSWWLLGTAVVTILFMAGYSLWTISHTSRGDGSRLPGVQMLLRLVPGLGRMMSDRSWSMAYGTSADAVDAGYALPEALRLASDTAVTHRVRRQLLDAAGAIDDGGSLASAASVAELPSLSRGLWGAMDQGGDATQTLAFLSRYHASRFSRAWSILRAALVPAIVIVLSIVVGWVVYSLFVPLVELIYRVTPAWEVM